MSKLADNLHNSSIRVMERVMESAEGYGGYQFLAIGYSELAPSILSDVGS